MFLCNIVISICLGQSISSNLIYIYLHEYIYTHICIYLHAYIFLKILKHDFFHSENRENSDKGIGNFYVDDLLSVLYGILFF